MTASFIFEGRFETDSFVAFARQRAARLDLMLAFTGVAADRIGVIVSGETDLVDAFEMACSLGPIDCLVLDLTRHSALDGKPA